MRLYLDKFRSMFIIRDHVLSDALSKPSEVFYPHADLSIKASRNNRSYARSNLDFYSRIFA